MFQISVLINVCVCVCHQVFLDLGPQSVKLQQTQFTAAVRLDSSQTSQHSNYIIIYIHYIYI